MNQEYYLGIDQGTSGTTAILLDRDFRQVSLGYSVQSGYHPAPGYAEQDGEELFQAARSAARQAIENAGIEPSAIRCIGLDNQGESIAAWDAETGKPLCPVITWQDKRTAADIEQLPAEARDCISSITGLVPDAYFSASKLSWILKNIPLAREKAQTGTLRLGTLDTFLIYRMTGGKSFCTDSSTASRTMLCDLWSGTWSDELLSLFSIPRQCLPEILPTAGLFGTAETEFLGAPIPITASAVDQQAALFGQCCFRPGELKTTYGTGCFLLINTGTKPVYSENKLLTTTAWDIAGTRTFALDGGVYSAGSTVNWLKKNMGFIENAAETEAMALQNADTGGVYFIPAFSGLSAPYWDQSARGTITGMTLMTNKTHIVRAALEGIAYQVADIVKAMEKDIGITVPLIRADGGLTGNRFLMQFQADILGIPIEVPVISEATAFGAAAFAALGAGALSAPESLSAIHETAVRYEPCMSAKKREELLAGWHDAVSRSRHTVFFPN